MTKLKLYDFPESVCCQKVRLAVAEKGIETEDFPIMLDQGMQYDRDFLELNPKGVVPVAVYGDAAITESTIISEFIDDAFDGPALMPSDPVLRARKRHWSRLIDDGIHSPHCTAISFVIALRFAFMQQLDTPEKTQAHLDNVKDPVSRERQRQGFEEGYDAPSLREALVAYADWLEQLEVQLQKTIWLAGNEISLADLDSAPYIHRLDCLGLSRMWADKPVVADWYARLKARPSWAVAIDGPHIGKWLELMAMGGEKATEAVDAILTEIAEGKA